MLYVVPTPIGNLEDFTFRSIRILKEVDIILVENYKISKKLLKHYNIKNKIKKYNLVNERIIIPFIIKKIKKGNKFALITDAGTPGISDPGFLLIKHCIKNFLPIECLPGATALIPALIISGFSTNEFLFVGFLPKKKRKSKLESLSKEKRTIILYESPHRLVKTLKEFSLFFGLNRNIVLCKEVSKFFQKTIRGNIDKILCNFINAKKILGEYTIIIEGK